MAWTTTERGATSVPYSYVAFPKHVYHVSGDQPFKVVNSEAEWAALGPDWGYPAPEAPAGVSDDEVLRAGDVVTFSADIPRVRNVRKGKA